MFEIRLFQSNFVCSFGIFTYLHLCFGRRLSFYLNKSKAVCILSLLSQNIFHKNHFFHITYVSNINFNLKVHFSKFEGLFFNFIFQYRYERFLSFVYLRKMLFVLKFHLFQFCQMIYCDSVDLIFDHKQNFIFTFPNVWFVSVISLLIFLLAMRMTKARLSTMLRY